MIFAIFEAVGFDASLWPVTMIFYKNLFQSMYFLVIKRIISRIYKFLIAVTIKLKIDTTQTRSAKNLAKSALWSDPYKMLISFLIRKT